MKGKKRRGVHREGKSIGKSAIVAASGAGVFYFWDNFLKDQKTLNEHWWARSVATAVGGHLVKRKSLRLRRIGEGVMGAAGFMFGQAYKAQQDAEKAKQGQPAQQAAGWMDAGALVGAPMPSGFDDASGPEEQTVYVNLPGLDEASGYDEEDPAAGAPGDAGALVGEAMTLGI